MDQQAIFTETSTEISSMEVAQYFNYNNLQVMVMWLRSLTVVDRRTIIFTGTSTEISSMEVALCLQSVTVVDQQATFTGTSTRISSMVMVLWLQSVIVWTNKPLTQILPLEYVA